MLLIQKMMVSLMDQLSNTIASDGRKSQDTLLVVLIYVLLVPVHNKEAVKLVTILNHHHLFPDFCITKGCIGH